MVNQKIKNTTDGQKCNLDGTKYELVKWDDSPDQYCSDTGFKVLTKKDVAKLKNLMLSECTNASLLESFILFKEEGAKNFSCLDPLTGEVLTCFPAPLHAVCKADKNNSSNKSKILLALFVALGVVAGLLVVACTVKVIRRRRRLKVG